MRRFIYDLQVWFARHFLPADSSPATIMVCVGVGRCVEVALCRRTPYYAELEAKLKDAQAYWGLPDEVLARYDIRFVPDWFSIVYPQDPWTEKIVMGIVAVDVREVRVAFRGDKDEDLEWERTLVHEFAHIYCHEHPEFGAAWDPYHKIQAVWEKTSAYRFTK